MSILHLLPPLAILAALAFVWIWMFRDVLSSNPNQPVIPIVKEISESITASPEKWDCSNGADLCCYAHNVCIPINKGKLGLGIRKYQPDDRIVKLSGKEKSMLWAAYQAWFDRYNPATSDLTLDNIGKGRGEIDAK